MIEVRYCKLSDYAKKFGVTYRTAFNRYNAGKIPGAKRDKDGKHIIVPIDYLSAPVSNNVVIYATVLSNKEEDQKEIEEQIKRLKSYCAAQGYRIDRVIKEYSSSITDVRPRLMDLLRDRTCKHIVVERSSYITRFGFEYIQTLLETDQREIEVVDNTEEDRETITRDFVKVIYSICKIIGSKKIPKKQIRALIDKLIIRGSDAANIDF